MTEARASVARFLSDRVAAVVGGSDYVAHERESDLDQTIQAIESYLADHFGELGFRATESMSASLRAGYRPTDELNRIKDALAANSGGVEFRRRALKPLQKLSTTLYHTDPVVKNVVQLRTALVIANGVTVEIDEESEPEAFDRWADFDERYNYTAPGGVAYQAWLNTLKQGERVHLFNGDLRAGELADEMFVLDPISQNGLEDVVYHDKRPTEIDYIVRRASKPSDRKIPGGYITYWNLNESIHESRSAPLIEPVFEEILWLRQTAVSIWILQEFMIRIAALRYYRGQDSQPLKGIKVPGAGINVLELSGDDRLEEPDLSKIIFGTRQDNSPVDMLLRRIGQGVTLPFHLVAQEFREANLASLVAAEGPTAKLAETDSRKVEGFIRQDVSHVIGPAEFKATVPPVIVRDPGEERKSWLEVRSAGEVSRQTFHSKIGVDPDEERDLLAKEEDENLARMERFGLANNPNENAFGDGDEGDDEGEDES